MKSKIKTEPTPHVTHGSVLDDLGFSPAESLEIKVKADVFRDLMTYIKSKGYTQQKLVALLGIPQPDVSNLMNGRVAKFSVAKLIRFAGKLDLGAEVRLIVAEPISRQAVSGAVQKQVVGIRHRA